MEPNSTSLHPPSFHRNDFPLVPLIFHSSFWGKSHFSPRAHRLYARACIRGQRPLKHVIVGRSGAVQLTFCTISKQVVGRTDQLIY